MLLMCLTVLACWVAWRGWTMYMMTFQTDDWLRLREAEHRRRVVWANMIGDRGKIVAQRIAGWFGR